MKSESRYSGLFDHGKKYTFTAKGFGGTNHNSLMQREARVKKFNDPDIVSHNFFSSDPVLIRWRLDDPLHSQIAMHRAGNPYGPIDSLVVAMDDSMTSAHMSAENMHARYVYEMSPEAQRLYWQTTLAELVALHQLPKPKEKLGRRRDKRNDYRAVAMENTTPISNIDTKAKNNNGNFPATSRTIFIPHLHTSLTNIRWLKEKEWENPTLDRENKVLTDILNSPLGQTFMQHISDDIHTELAQTSFARIGESLVLQPEQGNPLGYSLQLPTINTGNAVENAQLLSVVMRAHFASYASQLQLLRESVAAIGKDDSDANKKLKEDLIAVQNHPDFVPIPSFCDYIYFSKTKDGKDALTIRISPQFLSYTGVLERSGIEMLRGPRLKNPISESSIRNHRRKWVKKVAQLTAQATGNAERVTSRISKLPYPTDEHGKVKLRLLPQVKKWRHVNKDFPELDWI